MSAKHAANYEPEAAPRKGRSSKPSGSGDALKFVLLGLVLVLVVVVLILLFARCNRSDGTVTNAAASANVTSSVMAQDYSGKDLGKDLSVTAGTLAPPDVNPADAVLLDIGWSGKKAPDYPLILTVSDPSFVDGNGLIVFHFANGQWEKIGTYTIANHSVTFLADSLSPFAFEPYEKYAAGQPSPSGSPTPMASVSPSPSKSPSPSPSKSPSPSPTSNGHNSAYDYDPGDQRVDPGDIPSTPTPAPVVTDPPEDPGDDSGGGGGGGDVTPTDPPTDPTGDTDE